MSQRLTLVHFYYRSRLSIYKYSLTFALLCVIIYIFLKIKLLIDYHNAHIFYQIQRTKTCRKNINQTQNEQKLILFWTKMFSTPVDTHYLNNFLFQTSGLCRTDRCKVSNNRQKLCESDAVIFHARGGIKIHDMPKARSPHQRYVLLTKEPPYKTTAIVGHLNYFFNWTATVSVRESFSS